jgi:formylglycine-generating enzyme required for sulfatase activity
MKTRRLVSFLALALSALPTPSKPPVAVITFGKAQLVIVRIPSGTFVMGTNRVFTADGGWTNDGERPSHQVTITKDFWMGQFPVTQGQWRELMGSNPSYFQNAGPDAPVEQVSWTDVQVFLARLNAAQRQWTVRLPTEAEWEYAARAGTTGETYGPLDDIAWYRTNGARTTHPAGQKAPNTFGLYDMLGNVWQWCQDWFGPYVSAPAVDPQGAANGERRVTRGGCFYCEALHERAARRNRDLEGHSWRSIGFRIVAAPRAGGGGVRASR